MSQKRQPDEGKEGLGQRSPEEKRQKVPALQRVIHEAIKAENINKFLHALEPLLRRVVKEEVESALANHFKAVSRQSEREISPSPSLSPSPSQTLQLQFASKLSLPIFTGAKIEAENSSPLTICLVDSSSGFTISAGLELSLKVEIVVLEGDFDLSEKDTNWTTEEFKNYVVKEREGRRPLLSGDAFVELRDGSGSIGELSFTDNSSWTRSRRFRLGALAEDGCLNGLRIKEAVTESFMVKDHRGELYKKHHPPVLGDEVWRLEKIGKDGAFHKRLNKQNIKTVKEFLTLLNRDPARLRNILGNGMSTKMWEAVVEHARTCVLTNQVHIYPRPDGTQKQRTLVFNAVRELKGVISEQGQFISIDDLSEKETAEASTTAEMAYKTWENLTVCDLSALLGNKNLVCNHYNPMSPPYNNSSNILNADQFAPIHSPSLDNFALGVQREPRIVDTPLYDDSSNAYYDSSCLPYMDSNLESDLGFALRGFWGSPIEISHTKAYKVRWRRLSSVLGWIFYIKKVVARNKKGKERLC
ncbi:Calmodulin binding protein [Rhynchospora pubera]|uniref:Calmodulin binding protein n=1 Tax=Rhynchospora pubera TaxID=906938 RepID=A0AAV8HCS9_9POAL|nr:Calmodulin binding protein [Rhynchospora pubera]